MRLEDVPETTLLETVLEILSQPGPVTDEQREHLAAINTEIERREILQAERALYAVRRFRQRIVDLLQEF